MSINYTVNKLAFIILAILFSVLSTSCKSNTEMKPKDITQEHLNEELWTSQKRLTVVTHKFRNGKYEGQLTTNEAIELITNEIEVQKKLLSQYNSLPNSSKTDKKIGMRFFQLGKYAWVSEMSLLEILRSQQK